MKRPRAKPRCKNRWVKSMVHLMPGGLRGGRRSKNSPVLRREAGTTWPLPDLHQPSRQRVQSCCCWVRGARSPSAPENLPHWAELGCCLSLLSSTCFQSTRPLATKMLMLLSTPHPHPNQADPAPCLPHRTQGHHVRLKALYAGPGAAAAASPPGHEETRLRGRPVERLRGQSSRRRDHRGWGQEVRGGASPTAEPASTGDKGSGCRADPCPPRAT